MRPMFFAFFLMLVLQGAQAQVVSHGVPASVTSPTADGRLHCVPSSVVSPTAPRGAINTVNGAFFPIPSPRVRFGGPRAHRPRPDFVPVPIFSPGYGYYPYGTDYTNAPVADSNSSSSSSLSGADQGTSGDSESADSYAPGSNPDVVREAYYRGAHDAMAAQQQRGGDSRYGEHYFDSREKARPNSPAADDGKTQGKMAPEPPGTNSQGLSGDDPAPKSAKAPEAPPTIFIFKDGHQVETQNFAIVGQTVFDFSSKPLRKIQIAELDLDATRKANDDRGITVHL